MRGVALESSRRTRFRYARRELLAEHPPSAHDPGENGTAAAAEPSRGTTSIPAISSPARKAASRSARPRPRTAAPTARAATTHASTASTRRMRRMRARSSFVSGRARRFSIHVPCSVTNVCSARGRLRSTAAATGSAARTNHGVVSEVSADTATTTGKSEAGTTPAASPAPASMNENSPIWARLIPACRAVRVPAPVRNALTDTAPTLPTSTSSANTSTCGHSRATMPGSINMPTETKNTATNMSRTGSMSRVTARLSPDSATSEPARNAPSATDQPTERASRATPKHSPMLTTRVVSGRPRPATNRMSRGTTSIPAISSPARKAASRTSVKATGAADSAPPAASGPSAASSTIASRSSITSTPNTSSVKRPRTRCSAKARWMIVVEEIAIAPPANTLCSGVQPNSRAAV